MEEKTIQKKTTKNNNNKKKNYSCIILNSLGTKFFT